MGYSDHAFESRGFRNCEPKKKVAYLKTHKCASTTIQNILLRYGMKNNLNFVLPEFGINFGGSHFNRGMIKSTLWEKAGFDYHIFLLHTRWDQSQVADVLNDRG